MQPKFRIVLEADGRWLIDVRGVLPDGTTFRRREHPKVSKKKQAEAYAEALWEAALSKTIVMRKRHPTLSELWIDFKEKHVDGQRLKPSQKRSLQSIWDNHLGPVFGEIRIDKIDYEQIQAFKAARADKSPKTVNNSLIALKSMLRFAVKIGKLDKHPSIELLKQTKIVPVHYDVPTYNKLAEAAMQLGDNHAAIVLLGGDCGLRAGEILALDTGDVALPFVTVRRSVWRGHEGVVKGHAERVIPVTGRMTAVLARLARTPGPIIRTKNGTRYNYTMLCRALRQAQEQAGVEKLSLHKLRHTYGTDITRALGIRAAQALLGHSEVTTTERYAHVHANQETIMALELARAPRGQK